MQLHPIMYVNDQYAERALYELLGFETSYEGDEFPGFLALRNGEATFGLQRASETHRADTLSLRWQFELSSDAELEALLDTCRAHGLEHRSFVEEGGETFRTGMLVVRAPSGVEVWFEGPNRVASGRSS